MLLRLDSPKKLLFEWNNVHCIGKFLNYLTKIYTLIAIEIILLISSLSSKIRMLREKNMCLEP